MFISHVGNTHVFRSIVALIVALLAGVIVTVLVSWLAMFVPTANAWYGPRATTDVGLTQTSDGSATWRISEGANAWHRVYSYSHMQISGMSLMMPVADVRKRQVDMATLPRHMRPASVDDLHIQAWFHETGWPFASLSCSVHWKRQVSNANIIYQVMGGAALPRDAMFNPRALPLMPVLPGFVLNVLFYAGIWIGFTLGLGAWRSRRRTKDNRCAQCGYSREGLSPTSVCPECGTMQMVAPAV